MSGSGIAPGFGGFAVTPAGQAQYLARQYNPYAFLQQDQFQTGTAPAAANPNVDTGLAAAANAYRRGGIVRWRRYDEGGDTGGGDTNSGDGGNDTGVGGANSGAAGGTNGGYGGADAPGNGLGGFGNESTGIGQATSVGGIASAAAGMNGMLGGLTTAGQPSSLGADPVGMAMEQAPSMAQLGFAAAKGGLGGMVPGLGLAMSATGLTGAMANAMGVGAMGHGASVGSQIGGALGSAIGGPMGGALGSALGAEAGAHGASGSGMGGTASNAGTGAGAGTSSADGPDIISLITRIRDAMGQNTGSGHVATMATGGRVPAGRGPNHDFHGGSGLIHGSTDGRADALHMHVPAGGYVVPADVVSGLGQGNTMAGAKKIRGMIPNGVPHLENGGSVPVRLSSGEFFIHPAHVAALGGGSRDEGSKKLDTMVGHVRRINQAAVSGMAPPR